MKKFLAPAALVLALTASGAAFAAQANDNPHLSVYGETPVLTYDTANAVASGQHWQSANRGEQYASRATMTDTQAQSQQGEATDFYLHLPE